MPKVYQDLLTLGFGKVAALLWVTMLSSIALQLGGAEPGVESTYWWMGDDAKQKAKKGPWEGEALRSVAKGWNGYIVTWYVFSVPNRHV